MDICPHPGPLPGGEGDIFVGWSSFICERILAYVPELVVDGAADGDAALVEDVGIDHGGAHILVAEQFLYGTNIIAGFEKMGSKTMPQGVGCDAFVHAAIPGNGANGFLRS